MACICCSTGFTMYNPDPETRFIVGWVYLGFLGLILVLNVTVLSIDIVIGIIAYCKAKKERKRVEAENKLRNLKKLAQSTESADIIDAALSLSNKTSSKKKSIMTHLNVIEEDSEESESQSSSRSKGPASKRLRLKKEKLIGEKRHQSSQSHSSDQNSSSQVSSSSSES